MTDTWEQSQRESFLNWTNYHLGKRDIEIDTLSDAFTDGLNLIHLIEIISGKSVGFYSKRPRFLSQKIDNVNVGLAFVKREWNVNVYGCTPKCLLFFCF